MRLYQYRVSARNSSRGTILGNRIRVAESGVSRIIGLLGERNLAPGDGLLIVPSQGVHTMGMLFPIDVLVLDNDWNVIAMHNQMKPFLVTRIYFKAAAVLELSPGTIKACGTRIGDVVDFARVEELT